MGLDTDMVSLSPLQRIILLIGIIAFVTLGLFAPWDKIDIGMTLVFKDTGITELPTGTRGRHLIVFPPKTKGYQLAIDRLVVEWLIVIVLTVGLVLILKQNQTSGS